MTFDLSVTRTASFSSTVPSLGPLKYNFKLIKYDLDIIQGRPHNYHTVITNYAAFTLKRSQRQVNSLISNWIITCRLYPRLYVL